MGTEKQQFSCYIIGEESLVIQCAELILKNGHQLLGVVSSNEQIKEWANNQKIEYISSKSKFESVLLKYEFDYLFSIVNYHILPKNLLKKPRQLAINYHDALLPKYAGVHATSWAIINKEQQHGITWHVMTDKLDAGDILKQQTVTVNNKETALSLNLKCYQAAMNSFAELVDELASNTFVRTPQDLTQRTYNAFNKKPIGNSLIKWADDAEDIYRLHRALHFGSNHINRLSLPKFIIGKQAYIVEKITLAKKDTKEKPGTVLNFTKKSLEISTKTNNISLSYIKTIDGRTISIKDLCKNHRLAKGSKLPLPTKKLLEKLKKFSEASFKNETFWIKELEHFKPATIPFLPAQYATIKCSSYTSVWKTKINNKLQRQLKKCYSNTSIEIILLTLWLIYLYRIGNQENLGIALTYPDLKQKISDLESFFSEQIPLIAELNDKMNFADALSLVSKKHSQLEQQVTYLKDMVLRYPQLTEHQYCPAINTIIQDKKINDKFYSSIPINFIISPDGQIELFKAKQCSDKNLRAILLSIPGHLNTILEDIIQNPNQPISKLALLTQAERQKILIDWNNTKTDYPRDKTVHQLFEEQVEKTPNNIAVVFEDKELTYRELNEKANQLAHYLRKQGVKTETLVAICVERSLEMIIGILGIIKAGGAYVPIDPDYPQTRIDYILNDTKSPVIITQNKLTKYFKQSPLKLITLNNIKRELDKEQKNNLENISNAENLIYIVYTSGSTGVPKGVAIRHFSVNRLVLNTNYISIQKNDRIAQISNIAFDAATFEIWSTLLNSAKLIIIANSILFDLKRFSEKLHENKVNILWLTAALYNQIIVTHPPTLEKLKTLIVGGEALTASKIDLLLKNKNKPRRFLNGYGPTENTTFTTFYEIKKITKETKSIPIGQPLSNTEVFVLDFNKQTIPIGVEGELYIGGDGLASGYLNQAFLTKEKFILNMFTKKTYTNLYKTGDLVRWLPDGNLEYIGRTDSQVKIRGFRIELSEIESLLCKHPNISQAIVLANTTENDYKQLIGFLIKQKDYSEKLNDYQLNAEKIQLFLKEFLPDYAIPSLFYRLDVFPLTSNGKINRDKLLKLCYNPLPLNNKEVILPKNKLESVLLNIWQKILKIKTISVNDNFFALGGDSILAIQIAAKVRQAGWNLSIHQIFTYPTITELASKISTINSAITFSTDTSLSFNLSPIQQWFFNQTLEKKENFSHICLVDLNLPINIKKLEKCLEILVLKYGALNLSFIQTKNGWQQCLKQHNTIEQKILYIVKIDDLISADSNKHIEQWTYKLQSEFNLTKGPLFQAALLCYKNSSHAKLLIAAHHLIIDGVSWRILLEDLETLYYKKNFSNTQKIIQSHTFKDWVEAINAYAKKHKFVSEKNYWKKTSNIPCKIPLDFELGPNLEKNTDIIQTHLDVEETYLLFKQAPKVYNIRFHKLLIAALIKTLASWTKSKVILLNLETHGREELFNQVDISNTIGWFTNLFPACISSKRLNLVDYVQDIDIQLNKIAAKSITYGILRYLKKEGYQLNINPPISFNYWGQFNKIFSETSQFKFNWLRLVSAPENPRAHLIDIEAVINHGQLFINWTYSQNHHLQSTIARLANELVANLKSLLINSRENKTHDQPLTGFPPINLTSEQLKRLVEETEDTNIERIYPLTPIQKGLLFHSLYSTNSEVYSVQLIWTLDNINLALLRKAFQLLMDRHAILRTHFKWKGLAEPIQIVQKQSELLWQEYDWHKLSVELQQQRLDYFLKMDRQTGFAFNKAPLLRVTIIKNNDRKSQIILTLHHILIDGWSLPILLNELGKIYQAFIHQKNINLLDPPNFAHYIEWLQKQDSKKAKAFWENYLKGFTAPTDLVIIEKKIKNNEQDLLECSNKSVTLSRALTQQIYQFCKQHRLTLSTLFQGIWALLLNRYNQNDDIVFGITVSGRTPEIPDAEKMIGLMINTLPLRIRFNQDFTVINYLLHTQKIFSELMTYAYTPLSDIQLWSEVLTHSTLFESILVIENYPIEKIQGLHINFHDIEIIDPTHYPIALAIILDKQISLKFNYNSNAIQHDALQRLCGHVKTLLSEILNNYNKPIHKLNLLTAAEKQQILYEWNQTEIDYPRNKAVHQLFEEQVEKTPNNIAVAYEDQNLTYRELNEKSNQLAHYLFNHGVRTGDLVAICIERSISNIICVLATLKAGAAYLAIDPKTPQARFESMLNVSKVKLLLTQLNFDKIFQFDIKWSNNLAIIELDTHWDLINKEKSANLKNINNLNLMYVVFTSGSTGIPKGILQTHKTISNLINWQNLTDKSQVLRRNIAQFSNLSFDVFVQELFYTLLNGYQLHIIPPKSKESLTKIINFIKQSEITDLFLPTALLNLITEEAIRLSSHVPSLINIIVAGEALKINHTIKTFLTQNPKISLINHYGPCETHVVCAHVVKDYNLVNIPIGKPIANTKIFILDKNNKPTPIGIVGEIYIAGVGLSPGYIDQPKLNKQNFITNMFNDKNFILYKTGDQARWLADGNIEFIGRKDNQIKIRGFRIEPDEIQAHIVKHPAIKQAVVICRESANNEKYLTAYITINNKNKAYIDLKDLRNFLQKSLPDYMIPSVITKVDIIPITPNGKIDIKALSKIEQLKKIQKDFISAKTKYERTLVKIWSVVLNIQKISVDDNFFELGGHSLSALDVLSRIYSHYNLELPIRTLYINPTIKMLAKEIISHQLKYQSFKTALRNTSRDKFSSCLVPLTISNNKKPLFLIHPVGGTIFWYLPLIKYLDVEQAVYAIQDPGIESEIIPFQNIKEMASYYIELIRAKQPNGPYLLGGASGGAIISVEITKQLKDCGEKVSFLALLDGWAPYPDTLKYKDIFETNMRRQYHNLRTKFLAKGIDSADKLLNLQWERAQQIVKYKIPLLDQKLTLFKAETTLPIFQAIDDPFNHWDNHSTQTIELHVTPGNHETMFEEPNIQILAQKLNECLHRVHKNIDSQNYDLETTKSENKSETLLAI